MIFPPPEAPKSLMPPDPPIGWKWRLGDWLIKREARQRNTGHSKIAKETHRLCFEMTATYQEHWRARHRELGRPPAGR